MKYPKIIFISSLMLIQAVLMFFIIWKLSNYIVPAYFFLYFLSVAGILFLFCSSDNQAFKLSWVFLILLFPLFGGVIYFFMGNTVFARKKKKKMNKMLSQNKVVPLNSELSDDIGAHSEEFLRLSSYIYKSCGFTPSYNKGFSYFSPIENGFQTLLELLRSAQKHIYIEIFILKKGTMWDEIYDVLLKKRLEGVEVKIILDGFGSVGIGKKFVKELADNHIEAVTFNKMLPKIEYLLNYRDHKKLFIVDDAVVLGGFNISDDYINLTDRYGHWKDSMAIIRGSASTCFINSFLTFWGLIKHEKPRVCSENIEEEKTNSFAVAYESIPFSKQSVTKDVFLSVIHSAKKSLYLMNPYIVPDSDIISALLLAARSGVDVKLIVPKVYDKWYIKILSFSNFEIFLKNGIRIYQYEPGFVHSKVMLADHHTAVVSSANLDYRSFYFLMECGVCVFGEEEILDVVSDFDYTFGLCNELTLSECKKRPKAYKIMEGILRIFEPLL